MCKPNQSLLTIAGLQNAVQQSYATQTRVSAFCIQWCQGQITLCARHQPTKPGSGPRTAQHVASPRVTSCLCQCSIFCDQNLITKYTIKISFNYLGCCWPCDGCPVHTSVCLPRGKNWKMCPFSVSVSSDKKNRISLLSSTELMLNL